MFLELLDPPKYQLGLDGYSLAAVRLALRDRNGAEPLVFVNSFSKRLLRLRSYWTDSIKEECNGRPLGISREHVEEVLESLGLQAVEIRKYRNFEDEVYYFQCRYQDEAEAMLERYGWWEVVLANDVDYEE